MDLFGVISGVQNASVLGDEGGEFDAFLFWGVSLHSGDG